jgi:hypothetical protein
MDCIPNRLRNGEVALLCLRNQVAESSEVIIYLVIKAIGVLNPRTTEHLQKWFDPRRDQVRFCGRYRSAVKTVSQHSEKCLKRKRRQNRTDLRVFCIYGARFGKLQQTRHAAVSQY